MIISKVRDTIEKYGMIEKGDRIVVGVSGGPDSIFLMRALTKLKGELDLSLIIACLDHRIRGNESKMESEFVRDAAHALDLPFEFQSVDVPAVKKIHRLSTQQAARNVRYEFFLNTLRRYDAQKVALGHNADDQAETVLMRLIRGAGLTGLSGVPPIRNGIFIRPLIETRRSEIEDYLRKNHVEFVVDSSNEEEVYLRNRMRKSLMPVLTKDYNPRIVQNLVRTSEILRKEDEYLDRIVVDLFSKTCVCRNEESVTLSVPGLLGLDEPMRVRVLRKAIESFSGDLAGISFTHLESMTGILSHESVGKSINLPRGVIAERRYDELMIRQETKGKPFCLSFNEIPRYVTLQEIDTKVEFEVIRRDKDFRFGIDPNEAFMDFDGIRFPIIIRNFKEGDRFQPLGMEGTKKLKDFFADSKIPRSIRGQVPILIFGDLIAWVMGFRIDHRVMVKESSMKILKAKIL